MASARFASHGSAADAVDRRAVLAFTLVESKALVAQSGEGGAGGVGQPSGGRNQLIEGCAGVPLEQGDHTRLLRPSLVRVRCWLCGSPAVPARLILPAAAPLRAER